MEKIHLKLKRDAGVHLMFRSNSELVFKEQKKREDFKLLLHFYIRKKTLH